MCEPVSIATAAVASGGLKAYGDMKAADASASAQRRNAVIAEQEASDSLQRGEADAGKVQTRGEAIKGLQRVGFAAMGVNVDSGSAARAQADTVMLTEMDKQTVRNNAYREAKGLKKQAADMRASADATISAGLWSAAGDIIGGFTQAASIMGGPAPKPPGSSTSWLAESPLGGAGET